MVFHSKFQWNAFQIIFYDLSIIIEELKKSNTFWIRMNLTYMMNNDRVQIYWFDFYRYHMIHLIHLIPIKLPLIIRLSYISLILLSNYLKVLYLCVYNTIWLVIWSDFLFVSKLYYNKVVLFQTNNTVSVTVGRLYKSIKKCLCFL